jgi:hypothetical protein
VATRAVFGELDRADDPDGPAGLDPDEDAAGLAWECCSRHQLQVRLHLLGDQHRSHRLPDPPKLVERRLPVECSVHVGDLIGKGAPPG